MFSEQELATLLWATVVINAWNRLAISQRTTPESLGGPAPSEPSATV